MVGGEFYRMRVCRVVRNQGGQRKRWEGNIREWTEKPGYKVISGAPIIPTGLIMSTMMMHNSEIFVCLGFTSYQDGYQLVTE